MNDWLSDHLPIAATFSKDPRFWAKGFQPDAISFGRGAYGQVGWTTSPYLDWVSALGANLLGYSNRHFQRKLCQQIRQGVGFSLPHYLEAQVAEKLCHLLGSRVPGWSPDGLAVRFGLSGTDATTMAVRLARAIRRQDRILTFGYHGWADWSIVTTPPAWGTVAGGGFWVDEFEFNKLDSLSYRFHNGPPVAAVILEVPTQEPSSHYFASVRELCTRNGALLILDEVVTWPRFALGGACEYYHIQPDIICLGKGLGNGVPISAIVGRREYFEWFARRDPVFVSSTHFGNALSLAAADAVLDIWNQECVDHIWQIGQALIDGLREIGYSVIGHPPRLLIEFPSLAHKTFFVLSMRDRRVLWNRPTLPNLAHTMADVELTLKAAREIQAETERVDVEALMADKLPMVLFEGR